METNTPTAKTNIPPAKTGKGIGVKNFISRHKKKITCLLLMALILGLVFELGKESKSEDVTCTCPAPCTAKPEFGVPLGTTETEAAQKCQEACQKAGCGASEYIPNRAGIPKAGMGQGL